MTLIFLSADMHYETFLQFRFSFMTNYDYLDIYLEQ